MFKGGNSRECDTSWWSIITTWEAAEANCFRVLILMKQYMINDVDISCCQVFFAKTLFECGIYFLKSSLNPSRHSHIWASWMALGTESTAVFFFSTDSLFHLPLQEGHLTIIVKSPALNLRQGEHWQRERGDK